ncbi:MAG: 3'-5' exoribonuclease, partial [Mesorhizobium sp.]
MGNKPNAPVVAIGAVFFNPESGVTGAELSIVVDLESAMENGAKPDGKTIMWWLQKSEEARKAICSDDAVHINVALSLLRDFIKHNVSDTRCLRVWGNGAGFDNVILRQAYDAAQIEYPWLFRNDSDVRTMVVLGRQLGFDPKRDMPFDGVEH